MPAPNVLPSIAEKHKEPLDTLLPRVVEEEGSISGAAVRLGVAANTIQRWLRVNGYEVKTRQIATVVKSHQKQVANA